MIHATDDLRIRAIRALSTPAEVIASAPCDEAVASVQTELDLTLFAGLFVPPLGIRKRFVGTEPFSRTTALYNEQMKRLLPPLGIVVGIYVFWVGADLPGGKFQAGTLLAAMWLLTIMAGLTDVPPISRRWLRLALVAGSVVFLAIGFAGIPLAGTFLAYPEGFAKPLILVIEAASMVSIAVTLGLLVVGPPERSESP